MIYSISRKQAFDNFIPKNILGVYYFISSEENIIYIGKSKDVGKRIQQHIKSGRKRMIYEFKKIKILKLNTELEALLFESQEIKKFLPIFNRKLRKTKNTISIYENITKYGYKFFDLDHCSSTPILEFISKRQAVNYIIKISKEFNLCYKINNIEKFKDACFNYQLKYCFGACINLENVEKYNKRFDHSLSKIFKIPNDCKIIFEDNPHKTFVNIKNNRVISFGVKNLSNHKINYPSLDELKIVKIFQKKFHSTTIKKSK